MVNTYYYQTMKKEDQVIYHELYKGFLNFSEKILVPKTDGKTLADLFFQVRLDHPEIFWVCDFRYQYYQDSPNLIFLPNYMFAKAKIMEHQKAMRARVQKLSRELKGKNDWETEKKIHDFLCQNVHYDKLKKSYSHEIIGPLSQGVGVCEGIAKAVKVLCDEMGIWCMIALCGNNPEKGIKYRHVWNILRIDGKYYHLDVTFDNTLTQKGQDEIRYDYFNLDDKAVFRDHEPLLIPAPGCVDGDRFYYKETKKSFAKLEEVYKRGLQMAKKGKSMTFHWRGGFLTRTVLEEILEQLTKAGKEQQKKLQVRLNWPQAVLTFDYSDQMEETVLVEEANEEEECELS